MTDKYARFTFNQIADRRYFSGSEGFRVRLVDGGIHFHPTSTTEGQNVIPLMESSSGRMADIDSADSYSRRFMQILENVGYSSREPFFILREGSRGWLGIEHFPFDRPPAKNVPHFRVWALRWSPSATEPRDNTFDMKVWRQARQLVIRACETLSEYEADKKSGPPPKAVKQAKDVMGSLHQLFAEVAAVNKKLPTHTTDDVATSVLRLMNKRRA